MSITTKLFGEKKALHFKEELRRSFVGYAIIPSSFVILLIVIISLFQWYTNVIGSVKKDNKLIQSIFDESVAHYTYFFSKNNTHFIEAFRSDTTSLTNVFNELYQFTSNNRIPANFVLLDKNISLLLQGNSEDTFKVPDYLKLLEWGFFHRLEQNPNTVLIEISSNYTSSGLEELLIGSAFSDDTGVVGYLVFVISSSEAQKALWTIKTPYIITDQFEKVFTSTSLFYVNQFGRIREDILMNASQNGFKTDTILFQSTVYFGKIQIYTIIDILQLKRAFTSIIGLIFLFFVLLLITLFFTATHIASSKTKTIDILVEMFKNVEEGILEYKYAQNTTIEFQTITEVYNKMITDITFLIEKNKQEEKEKVISELKHLELQFNPHFLYNTLENIKFMVKFDADLAQKMIVSLSEILRYSISQPVSFVSIKEDFNYIQSFLSILKMRFTNKLTFSIEIFEGIENALIPKLIIQPVIENAVKYGFDDNGNLNLTIVICKQNEHISIVVCDKGNGIDEQELRKIQTILSSSHNESIHIGLYNIHRRIQLLYGENFGVSIESKKKWGTRVQILLPLKFY